MKRRTFIKSSMGAGVTLLSLPVRPVSSSLISSTDMMATWISENDLRIEEFLQRQTTDSNHPFAGGFPDRYSIYHASTAASSVRDIVAGFVSPRSRYHATSEIEASLRLAINFLQNRQHSDGTIDLVTTNFHSPPDTGFVVEPLAIALNCLRQHAGDAVPDVQRRAGEFLVRAGTALTRGGIHTPNHRWVVCMALGCFPTKSTCVASISGWPKRLISIPTASTPKRAPRSIHHW